VRLLPPLLLVVALLGAWEAVVRLGHVASYLLPAPDALATTFYDDWSVLGPAAWVTLKEVLLGFLAALAVGLALAIVLHVSSPLRKAFYPLLIGSQNIPIVVIAPIMAILLGFGIGPKVIVVALTCFFSIVVNTLDGLRSVDPELKRMMKTLYGTPWATFRRVEFPAALPSIFTGVRIAATFAAVGAVFAEWSGSNNGLGFVMLQATPQLETALVFAAIVLLAVMAIALFGLVTLVERLSIPWAFDERERQ
jgi:putative hydroxymethylpyrimidine transport system permease protein